MLFRIFSKFEYLANLSISPLLQRVLLSEYLANLNAYSTNVSWLSDFYAFLCLSHRLVYLVYFYSTNVFLFFEAITSNNSRI